LVPYFVRKLLHRHLSEVTYDSHDTRQGTRNPDQGLRTWPPVTRQDSNIFTVT